jgi:hypothetical protein
MLMIQFCTQYRILHVERTLEDKIAGFVLILPSLSCVPFSFSFSSC